MFVILKRLLNLTQKSGDYFYYVLATVMNSGFHFIYSMYVKAYVAPLEYGMYSTCLLMQTYLTYIQLGSMNAFNRDYPQLLGAGKTLDAKRYRDTTFTFLFLAFSTACIIICIVLFIMHCKGAVDIRYLIGFAFCAVTTFVTIIENFGANRSRAEGKIKFVSSVILVEMATLLIGALIVAKIGYYGIYVTTLLGMFTGVICYMNRSYGDISFVIDNKLLASILISGLPLLVNGLIWTIVNSIEKFIIIGFINTEALGLYAIAQNAFTYMVLVPTAISQLFYVKMGRVYGETKEVKVLNETAIRFTGILAVVVSYLCVFAFFLSPLLVEKLMPNYMGGIRAAQILILGLAVYAPTLVNGNILTILRENSAILRSSLYLCALNTVCSCMYILIFGPKIESVALGTVTAYISRTFIIIYQLKICANCKVSALMKCSVYPVLVVIFVTVVSYSTFNNCIIGLCISLLLITLFYIAIYRSQIKKLLKGGE